MAHVVVFNKLAFQKRKTDASGFQTIEADGQEEVVSKGGRVPDYVDLATLSALETAGMIVAVGDGASPIVEEVGPIAPIPTAPVFPPAGPQPVLVDTEGNSDVDDDEDLGPAGPTPMAPKASDNRKVWEDYAVGRGMDRAQAESYSNKNDLIEAASAL